MASAASNDDDADEYYSRMVEAAQLSVASADSPTSTSNEHRDPPAVVESPESSVKYQPPPAKDFEKIAKINATINRMTVGQVREELSTLRLDTRGNKATLVKRLKSYYKRRRLEALNRAPKKKNTPDRYYDYLLVLDFECTCEDNVYEYNHEIIEFPVVLVCTKQMRIVDEFHAYVKPQMHAQLSDFCSRLTGISQAQVDAARPFPAVFDDFRAWMCQRNLIDGGCRFAFVTDGPWDLAKFFQMQCYHSGYDTVPHDFRYWVNVRRTFTNQMGKPGQQGHKGPHDWKNLAGMLTALGMKFEGREHSGIDDARNIARIVIYMLQHGCDLRVNERLMRRDVAEKKLEERRNRSNYKPYPPRDATLLSGTEPRSKSPEQSQSQEDKERQFWREHLPYKVVTISKPEFQLDQYEECETCDEAAGDDDEEE